MKNVFVLQVFLFSCLLSMAQNSGKKLWAKSYIHKNAPELVVKHWITKKPNTQGKFVLIDFWATWCGPCRKAIPDLNKFSKKFKDNLVVIGISGEEKSKVDAFTKKKKISYYLGVDTTKTTSNQLQIKGIPHVIIVDPNGIVRWEGFPLMKGHELKAKTIKKIIETYKN